MTRLATLLLLLLPLSAGCSAPSSATSADKVWNVGSDLDNPPFAAVDDSGAIGRDVEMMEEIAERSGVSVVWKRMPFDELLDAVRSGEVDVVCATLGITDERERIVDFSSCYFETSIAIVVRDGAGEPTTMTDLASKKVGAAVGTTSEQALREFLPKSIAVLENKSGAPTLERLVTGELDAAVMDGPAARAMAARSAGKLSVMKQTLTSERYALVVREGREDLLSRIDAALESMRRDGSLAELNQRFGLRGE